MAQHERGALERCQLRERALERAAELACACELERLRRKIGDALERAVVVRVVGERSVRAAHAQRGVDGDAVEPARESGALIELRERAIRVEQRFLHSVLRERAVAEDAHRDAEQAPPVVAHQGLEREVIAALGGSDQRALRVAHVDWTQDRRPWLAKNLEARNRLAHLRVSRVAAKNHDTRMLPSMTMYGFVLSIHSRR